MGKPSVRPRCSPRMTMPRTACGRPEQPRRGGDVAGGQQLPDPGGGDPMRAVEAHGLDHAHLKPERAAQLLQQGHVPGATRAEPEISADEHDAGVQRVDQDVLHELLRRLCAERAIEVQHHRRVDTGIRQQFAFLFVAHQRVRAPFRRQDAERVPVEGEHRRGEPCGVRRVAYRAQHAAVAGVQSVEFADGDRRRPEIGGDIRQRGEEQHRLTLLERRRRGDAGRHGGRAQVVEPQHPEHREDERE